MKTKICKGGKKSCGIEKPLSEFHKHPTCIDGYLNQCKICKNKISREYNKNNKEDIEKVKKIWRDNNPEKVKETNRKSCKKWRENNPDYRKEYYKNNKK